MRKRLEPRAIYVFVLIAVTLPAAVTGLFWPVIGIARCNGAGYSSDVYLAYCESQSYGDYEHGAFYFDLEPEAVRNLKAAQVLVLGNSRAQVGFSTQSMRDFAARHDWRVYLLGFSYLEGSAFPETLIRRYGLRPKAVIINADPFFTEPPGAPSVELLAPGAKFNSYVDYLIKKLAQTYQRKMCGTDILPSTMCGKARTIFRSKTDGSWEITHYRENRKIPIVVNDRLHLEDTPRAIAAAKRFFASTDLDPKCAVLTVVPSDYATPLATTDVARAIGASLVMPNLSGLRSFDTSHLDEESAERWSSQFLSDAERTLRQCLGEAVAKHS